MQSVKSFVRRLSVTAPTLLATARLAAGPFAKVPFRTYGFFFDRGNYGETARVQLVGNEPQPKFDPSKPYFEVPFSHGFSVDDEGHGQGALPDRWTLRRGGEPDFVLHDGKDRYVADNWPQTTSSGVQMNNWRGKYSINTLAKLVDFVRMGGVYLHFGGLGPRGEAVREQFARDWAASHAFNHLDGPNCYTYLRDEMLHMVDHELVRSTHLSKDELLTALRSMDLKGITVEALARDFDALGLVVQGEGSDPGQLAHHLRGGGGGAMRGVVTPAMSSAERKAAIDDAMPRTPLDLPPRPGGMPSPSVSDTSI